MNFLWWERLLSLLAVGQVASSSTTGIWFNNWLSLHYLRSACEQKVEVDLYPMRPQFLKEHFFLEGSHALPICLISAICRWRWVLTIDGMILKGKLKYLEENLSQCDFVQHKPHMGWSGIKPRLPTVRDLWLTIWTMAQSLLHFWYY
jgi:hypothetical protein